MKTNIKILTFILYSIIEFNINAQQQSSVVKGVIIDNVSSEPLLNATVSLANNTNKARVYNILTDDKGVFYFNNIVAGTYTLHIRSLGYELYTNAELRVENNSTANLIQVKLQSKSVALEEITVTAPATRPFTEIKEGKIIVNVAKSPLAAGDNALDILLRSPGISEQNGSLNFRGKTISVLIDGKLLHLEESDLNNMLNSMPANSIESIEIIANPSSKYDANGGSLINIVLVKNKHNGLNGNVVSGLGTGLYLKWTEGINLYYRNKKLNLYGSYDFESNRQYYENQRKIDNYENTINQRDYETRARKNNTYKLGLDYEINAKNKVGFMYRGGVNRSDMLGDVNTNLFTASIKTDSSSLNRVGTFTSINHTAGLYYILKLDSVGRQLALNLDYIGYEKRKNSDFFALNGDAKLPFLNNNSLGNINSYSLALDYTQPTPIGKFEVGLKFQKNTSDNINTWRRFLGNQWVLDTTKSNHFIYNENINAAYLSYSKVFSTKYSLRFGIRTEQTVIDGLLQETKEKVERNYIGFFPNLSFEYKKNLDHIFSIDYRRSIDRFGFEILNPFVSYQGQNLYSQGNSKIEPQINNNYELTYTFKQNFMFGMSYTLTENAVSALYMKGNNNTVIATYGNQKNAQLFYVYANITHEIMPVWTLNIDIGTGYFKYNTNIDLTGKYNPSWSYRFEFNNAIKLNNNWNIQFNGVLLGPYSTGLYRAESNFTSSLGIGKAILNNKGSLNLAVKDVFNTNNQTTYFENNNLYTTQFTKKESRFLTLTFSYKFGNKKEKIKPNKGTSNGEIETRISD